LYEAYIQAAPGIDAPELPRNGKKVVWCTPCMKRPTDPLLGALASASQVVNAAGWEEQWVSEVGNPYISNARNAMLRKALDAKADVIVFLDYDLSFSPGALLKLIETEGDVVAGTYRYKDPDGPESYMGKIYTRDDGRPRDMRPDGTIKASCVPAGFLKVTKEAVDRFMGAYPALCYGPRYNPHVDLFNHGAFGRLWFGEDYAFSRNWNDLGGEIWLVPDLDITHHDTEGRSFPGNFHRFLLQQPGGVNDPARNDDGR